MTQWSILRRHLSRVAYTIAFMLAGATILYEYLGWNDAVFRQSWSRLDKLFYLCLLAFAVGSALRPDEDRLRSWSGKLSPDYSGGAVILMTGATAAAVLWWQQGEDNAYLVPGLILAATIAGAVAAWRYAKANEAEIGEARFKR